MLRRLIEWSTANRFIVGLATLLLTGAGDPGASRATPLDALPDLSDVQVIVQTDLRRAGPPHRRGPGHLSDHRRDAEGARRAHGAGILVLRRVVRLHHLRGRHGPVLGPKPRPRVPERHQGAAPGGRQPTLGPDATGLGWVYQYALEDTTGRLDLAQLRGVQDWHLRYALTAVQGVAEVATVGGFEKQYQVDLDPARLQVYGVPITRVMAAIQNANADVGAMVVELSEREYMVRGLGYLRSIPDIENVVVSATAAGTPIRVAELGRVTIGPAVRRGVADLDGRGDAVGGIVVMRSGENALATIERVKARLASIAEAFPPGWSSVPSTTGAT